MKLIKSGLSCSNNLRYITLYLFNAACVVFFSFFFWIEIARHILKSFCHPYRQLVLILNTAHHLTSTHLMSQHVKIQYNVHNSHYLSTSYLFTVNTPTAPNDVSN